MSEAGIVLMCARATRSRAYRGRRNRMSGVSPCATCKSDRGIFELDDYAGFCRACLDRSRIVDGDDLGGEC